MSIKMEGKFEAALSRIDAIILKLRQPYSQPFNVPWFPTGHPQIPIEEVTNPHLISTSLKGTPVKLKFPKFPFFKEGDPREWICEIEKCFNFYEIPGVHEISESQKLNCATLHLRGRASQWFHRHIKPRIHEISWSLFLEKLIDQFDSTELEDSNKSIVVDEVNVIDVVSCEKNRDGVVFDSLMNLEMEDYSGEKSSEVFDEMQNQEGEGEVKVVIVEPVVRVMVEGDINRQEINKLFQLHFVKTAWAILSCAQSVKTKSQSRCSKGKGTYLQLKEFLNMSSLTVCENASEKFLPLWFRWWEEYRGGVKIVKEFVGDTVREFNFLISISINDGLCYGSLEESDVKFDDYGRSLGPASGSVKDNGCKIVRAVPKIESQQDVKNGVQKFRVKLLPEGASVTTMDVLCQIGLDGIRMPDPSTNRTLRIYPLENVTRWDVLDSSIFTFWSKSPVDIEPRRIRLQSNSYTTNTILDMVTAATVQLKEMGGKEILGKGIGDAVNSSDQQTEKKKGFADWRNLMKPGNGVKDDGDTGSESDDDKSMLETISSSSDGGGSNSEDDSGSLEMIVVREVEAEAEVYNTYGIMGNATLLHRYGITETEIQKLKREKESLTQEVVQLRQDQLLTVDMMDALKRQIHSLEMKQKQMVAFSARVVQNPEFVSHLKQLKEQREISLMRAHRKFLKHQRLSEHIEGKQELPNHLLIENLGSDTGDQEVVGIDDLEECKGKNFLSFETDSGSDYIVSFPDDIVSAEMISEDISSVGLSIISAKGKEVVTLETEDPDVVTEYHTAFLQSISQEHIFPETTVPTSDCISEGGIWDAVPDAGGSSVIWENLVCFDDKEMDAAAGYLSSAAETTTNLARIVSSCVRGMDLGALSACLAAVVCSSEQPPLRPLGSPAGDEASIIIKSVLERAADRLTDLQAANKYSTNNPIPTLWQASFDAFFGLLTNYCLCKYESIMQSMLLQSPNAAVIGTEATRSISREMPVELLRASLPHTKEHQRKTLLDFAQRSMPHTGYNAHAGSGGPINSESVPG